MYLKQLLNLGILSSTSLSLITHILSVLFTTVLCALLSASKRPTRQSTLTPTNIKNTHATYSTRLRGFGVEYKYFVTSKTSMIIVGSQMVLLLSLFTRVKAFPMDPTPHKHQFSTIVPYSRFSTTVRLPEHLVGQTIMFLDYCSVITPYQLSNTCFKTYRSIFTSLAISKLFYKKQKFGTIFLRWKTSMENLFNSKSMVARSKYIFKSLFAYKQSKR